MSIRSRTIKRGDPKESTWPSDYGERGNFTKKVFSRAAPAGSKSPYVIEDTMKEIKSPINPNLRFSSKRAYTKHIHQNGYEIVGNEYDRGYDPGAIREKELEKRVDAKIKQSLIDRIIHGKR